LEERLSDAIVEATANGDADIGIFADNVDAATLEKAVYRHDRLVLLVPPSHQLAELDEIAFADSLEFDYVGLSRGSSLLARLLDAAVAADRPMKLRFQVSSFDAICRMIEAGHGIGVLPEGSVRQEILGAGLRALRLTDAWALRTLWVGVRSSKELQPEAARLFSFLSSRTPGEAQNC
jgi:DNA-binding transcriptional LysR family regulator